MCKLATLDYEFLFIKGMKEFTETQTVFVVSGKIMGRNGNNNNNTQIMLIFKEGKDNCPGNFSPVTEG